MSHHKHPTMKFDSHFPPQSKGVNYGLLRGKVVKFGADKSQTTPHFQIIVQDDTQIWRAAVNVRSDDGSNDQAAVIDPLDHPILQKLDDVEVGYTSLPDHIPGLALDFVRQPIFKVSDLQVLPPFGAGNSGVEDRLSELAQKAIDDADNGAEIYVWGSRFDVGNKPVPADLQYGDKVGIHDIHMNQGNPPPHQKDNGKFQDGGIIFRFSDRFVGVFMKFQSQVGKDDKGNVIIP